jgi:hypothetical protein
MGTAERIDFEDVDVVQYAELYTEAFVHGLDAGLDTFKERDEEGLIKDEQDLGKALCHAMYRVSFQPKQEFGAKDTLYLCLEEFATYIGARTAINQEFRRKGVEA